MDEETFSGDPLVESFNFIRRINLLGGGQRAVMNGLACALKNTPKNSSVKVLDVGCGIGDMGPAILRWGRSHGFQIHYTGLEKSPAVIDLARANSHSDNIDFVQGDIFDQELPRADIVIASMVFHHFEKTEIVKAIRHLSDKAGIALIVNDLERSWWSYIICLVLTGLLRNPESRFDALVSIRKGFLADEIESMIHEAGKSGLVRRAIGWRILAVIKGSNNRN